MKLRSTALAQIIHIPHYWLLGTSAGLVAIHLTLVDQSKSHELQGISFLFWAAVAFLVWQRRDRLHLESSLLASVVGLLCLAIALLRSLVSVDLVLFLRIFPLLVGIGVGLLASGLVGLRQYWRELIILAIAAVPPAFLYAILDPSTWTAQCSTLLLWLSGFSVSREGVNIFLPTGSVEVNVGCSGILLMLQLLKLSIVYLIIFPTHWIQKGVLPIVAGLIAFTVNSVRVALLATLSNPAQQATFDYWHGGDGSLVFSMIGVVIFGLMCQCCTLQETPTLEEEDFV